MRDPKLKFNFDSRYSRFCHYAHVILHIEKPRKKHPEQNLKKRTRHASLSQIDINSFSVIDFGVNAEVDDQMSLEIGFVPS